MKLTHLFLTVIATLKKQTSNLSLVQTTNTVVREKGHETEKQKDKIYDIHWFYSSKRSLKKIKDIHRAVPTPLREERLLVIC